MIDRDHDLSIVRQAKVLKLARSTVYYEPRPVSAEDLALMRRLDELHLDYPFAGARMLRSLLRREGVYAGRCQSACKFDPSSASNFDPFPRRGLLVALVSSELAGIAEARRARVA
ncbi:hypothetical protein ABIF69_002643 [Bradyrhizobium japonicum]